MEFKPSFYSFIGKGKPVELRFTATMEQGIIGSDSRTVEITEPQFAILNPIALPMPLYNANAPVELHASANGIDSVQWYSSYGSDTDESMVLTGSSGTVRFTQTGSYAIRAVAKATGLDEHLKEVERLYEPKPITIKVRDRNNPVVVANQAKIRVIAGNPETIPVSVRVTTGNAVVSTVWKVDQTEYSFDHLHDTLDLTLSDDVLAGKDILQTSIRCTVKDEYGMEGTVTLPCEIVSSQIAITSPRPGMRFANNATMQVSKLTSYADSIAWSLDGKKVEDPQSLVIADPGKHELTMTAKWLHGVNQVYEKSVSTSFEVVNSIPPVLSLQFPKEEKSVLVAGLVYQFKAAAKPASGTTIDSIWWVIDGKRYNQTASSVVFQATSSTYGRILDAACYARDSSGLESVVHSEFEVIDPWLALETPALLTSFTTDQVETKVASREVVVRWLVDGAVSQQTGNSVTSSFATPGFHTLQAVGEAVATAPNGNLQTYKVQTNPVTVQVFDGSPVTLVSSVPANRDIIALRGSEIGCKVFASSPNGMSFVRWTVKDAYNANVITTQDLSPDAEFVFQSSLGNILYVTAEAFDAAPVSNSRKATMSFVVRIIDPALDSASVENGKNYREGTDLRVLAGVRDLSSVEYVLDGTKIAQGTNINQLKPGIHTLEMIGTYVVSDRQGNPVEQKLLRSVSFSIQRMEPPHIELKGLTDNERLLEGESYKVYADVRTSGSSHTIDWYQKHGSVMSIHLGSGDELTLRADRHGTTPNFDIVCEVTDELGLQTQKSIPVTILAPSLSINTFNGSGDYQPIFQEEHLNLYSYLYDIDNFVWKVDGVPLLENPLWITLGSGEHTITLEGSTYALLPTGRRGNRTFSASKTVKVYQSLDLGLSLEKDHVYVDQDVHAKALLTGSLETFKLLRWYVDDVLHSVSNDARSVSLRYSFNEPGYHTIRAELTDSKNVIKTAVSKVRVSAPSIVHILRPDTVTAHRDFTAEAVVMQQGRIVGSSAAQNIQWMLDGKLQQKGTLLPTIAGAPAGPHTLLVSIIDLLGGVASDKRTVNAVQGFAMSLPSIDEVVIGVPQVLSVVLSNIQPEVDLNQVYKDLTWFVDGKQVAVGLQLQVGSTESPGIHTVQVRYNGSYGMHESPVQEFTVRTIQ
ncbi:MAG: hypothetical protein VB056_08530, partial [Sphaerochaeta associata]|uniref:hypothetical protein n=1 Tax=Sphaerochaeta associata TaxID=1129264 RepID=UPI002B2024B9